jgi:hypothetical protein
MFSRKDEWPSDYNPKLADHIHAIGVVALRFSQFEACLRDLYLRLASGNHDDLENIDREYLKLNDEKRAKAIRKQAKQLAVNADLIACSVDNLIDFFDGVE